MLKRDRTFFVFSGVILAARIFLLAGTRAYIIADAGYDDRLMMNIAKSLNSLEWLGSYNQLTLAKGITFPLYLAVLHQFSIPFLLANSLFCYAAALVFVYVFKEIVDSRVLLSIIFTALMFNPVTYATDSYKRIYRDSIYQYLVILLFSCAIAVYLNHGGSIKKLLLWNVLTGIFLSLTWFAREDSLWVAPFVAAALLIAICFIIFHREIKRKALRCGITLIPAVILLISYLGIAGVNNARYGVFLTNDYVEGNFVQAYKALVLVKPVDWQAKVPVTTLTRKEIARVCPAFQKIEPYLENHDFVKGKEPDGGHFPWALRDSVEEAGFKDAKSQQAYYKELADELNGAFDKGLLKKRSGYIFAFVSPWDGRYVAPLKSAFGSGLKALCSFSFASGSYSSVLSSGSNSGILTAENFTNSFAYYPQDTITATIKDKIVTKIQRLYPKYIRPFVLLGLLCYLYLTVMLAGSLKSKRFLFFDVWIILTGLLLSFIIRLLLTSYTTISAFSANNNMYLASSYWILLIFIFVSICVAFLDAFKRLKIMALKKSY